jgi:radical SAM-linked protein
MLLRAVITKGEQVRYISHLDFARTIERALRRAQLPVAYSEGFNPHVKLAFASALSVGVTGAQEYFDVELAEELPPAEFVTQLNRALPAGIAVPQAAAITQTHKALMAVINYAAYSAELPAAGEPIVAEATVASFNAAETVMYTRQSPKGRREIDLKQFVENLTAKMDGNKLLLTFGIAIKQTGSAKASELLEVLTDHFGLPGERELALIRREGLWIKQGDDLISPLELRG